MKGFQHYTKKSCSILFYCLIIYVVHLNFIFRDEPFEPLNDEDFDDPTVQIELCDPRASDEIELIV